MLIQLYRWQDADGRGPYKPGTSHFWADEDNQSANPPFFIEFGWGVIDLCRSDENMGCAFRTIEQAHRWFTPKERERMYLMGYRFGRICADRVLAESEHQVVFARKKPLRIGFDEIEMEAAL